MVMTTIAVGGLVTAVFVLIGLFVQAQHAGTTRLDRMNDRTVDALDRISSRTSDSFDRTNAALDRTDRAAASLRDDMVTGFATLRDDMVAGFATLEKRFDAVDQGFNAMGVRLDRIETRLIAVENR